jgi:hypothetical protein
VNGKLIHSKKKMKLGRCESSSEIQRVVDAINEELKIRHQTMVQKVQQ